MGNQRASAHRRNKEISELSTCAEEKSQKAPTKQWDELDLSHLRKVHNLPPCVRVASKTQGLNICPVSSLLKVRRYFVSQLIFVRNKGQAACPVFPGKGWGSLGAAEAAQGGQRLLPWAAVRQGNHGNGISLGAGLCCGLSCSWCRKPFIESQNH